MCWFNETLAPGVKRDSKIYLSDWNFCYNDIGDYTDIELVFQVQDDSSHENVLERKTVHIYPYGEDKAAEFVREAQPSDKIILDNEYATVIFVGEANEKYKERFDREEYNFETFVINKTDKRLMICRRDSIYVNGFKSDQSGWYTEVDGGKCSFSNIQFTKEDLEKYGIKDYEDIEEIKFKLGIYDFSIDDYGFYTGIKNLLGGHEITLNP